MPESDSLQSELAALVPAECSWAAIGLHPIYDVAFDSQLPRPLLLGNFRRARMKGNFGREIGIELTTLISDSRRWIVTSQPLIESHDNACA